MRNRWHRLQRFYAEQNLQIGEPLGQPQPAPQPGAPAAMQPTGGPAGPPAFKREQQGPDRPHGLVDEMQHYGDGGSAHEDGNVAVKAEQETGASLMHAGYGESALLHSMELQRANAHPGVDNPYSALDGHAAGAAGR